MYQKLTAALVFVIAACASPDAPVVGPGDEGRGHAIVERAAAALGGVDRLAAVEAWHVEGHGRENLSAEVQGLAPGEPTWRDHEEAIGVDATTMTVAWERRTPRNDFSLRWRRFIYRADTLAFVDWNVRRAGTSPRAVPEADRRALARRAPHVLVLEAATRATHVAWHATLSIDGRPHDVVEVTMPGESPLRLTVARDSALLRRVEYDMLLPGRGDVTVGWEWTRWAPDPLLGFVPAGHRVDVGGVLFQEATYSRYDVDRQAVAALITMPEELGAAGAAGGDASAGVVAAPTGLAATGEVAPGVHVAVIGGFVVMFVEMRDFVVAVEAPAGHPGLETIPARVGGPSLTPEYLEAIAKAAPGKPVRFVVVGHHHSDHLGGVRGFAAAGATIVAAPGHRDAVREALSAPHSLAPGDWSGHVADAVVETVSDRRVIENGGRRIEILNVGANPHTTENLVVWLPAERLLFQGDLFYYAEGTGFPPPGRGTMNAFFARWLRDRAIAPRGIYGVHNRGAAGPAAVAASID